MINSILHPNTNILERNIKMYNLLNGTKYTFDNLNIIAYDDVVFYCYKTVTDNFLANDKMIANAKEAEIWFSDLMNNIQIDEYDLTIQFTYGKEIIFIYRKSSQVLSIYTSKTLHILNSKYKFSRYEIICFIEENIVKKNDISIKGSLLA